MSKAMQRILSATAALTRRRFQACPLTPRQRRRLAREGTIGRRGARSVPPARRAPCCPFHASGGHPQDRHGFDPFWLVYGPRAPVISSRHPCRMSAVPCEQVAGFYMDVDAADLAAMDEIERQADERYRAACERENHGGQP